MALKSGAVCGLITKTRGETTDLGGRGVPTSTILSTFGALRKQNVSFHNDDIQWLQTLSASQRRALQRSQRTGDGEALLLPAGYAGLALALLGITIASVADGEVATPVKPYGDWKLVGPAGAFVQDLEIDPHENRTLYVALENGQGIFRSDDAGHTWLPKDLGLGNRSVADLAFSPHDGSLHAATRKGLWISHDHGDTWVPGHIRFKNLELLRVVSE